MKLKKINAVITLLIILLTIDHMVYMSATLFGAKSFDTTPNPLGVIFLVLFCVHALLSICIFFFSHSDSGKLYPNNNKQTIVQRITAIVLILSIHCHWINKTLYPAGGTVRLFVTELILLFAVAAHIGTSADRALTTLGIEKKWVIIVIRILMVIAELSSLAGLIYYNFVK